MNGLVPFCVLMNAPGHMLPNPSRSRSCVDGRHTSTLTRSPGFLAPSQRFAPPLRVGSRRGRAIVFGGKYSDTPCTAKDTLYGQVEAETL